MKTKFVKRAVAIVMVLVMLSASANFSASAAQPEFPPEVQSILDIFDAAFGSFRQIEITPEAQALVLEDFDYLVYKILATIPTIGVAERLFEISLEEYFAMWRQVVVNNVPLPALGGELELLDSRWVDTPNDPRYIAADYTFSLMLGMLDLGLGSFAHLGVQPLMMYEILIMIAAWFMDEDNIAMLEELYGPDYRQSADHNINAALYEIITRPATAWLYGVRPEDLDLDMTFDELFFEIGDTAPDNITTKIIEEGRIAYFQIDSFMNSPEYDFETLLPFFEEIQYYEHLIIDLRGNLGGLAIYFPILASILANETLSFRHYEFFRAHPSTAVWFDNPNPIINSLGSTLYDVVPAAQLVQSHNFTHFARGDLAYLDYVLIWDVVIEPFEYEDYNLAFGGEIWMLVDEMSMSASQQAALTAVATGFATVVGEPTSQISAVTYTFLSLPNSGVLIRTDLGLTIDPQGRALEETGVIPDIANLPGMDALETLLYLLATDADIATIIAETTAVAPPITPVPEPVFAFDPFALVRRVYHNGSWEYVHLRIAAYAHDATVEWDGENNAVILTLADGTVRSLPMDDYLINLDGTIILALEEARRVFA
ncbi:MAG: S41 family peptidase [Defluviitaleaceae bacterium]|nr:S41 family peptidase [Defluviitaleaceae bacterium]